MTNGTLLRCKLESELFENMKSNPKYRFLSGDDTFQAMLQWKIEDP